ncbi:acyl-[acyl-carrier-protein] thioesterase [Mycolicibacterium arenosum]|uniref:Acyl-[acyl-carrier-protein] thioesterase n=1 Tax=Mycolicibacterium arenosum TaxID=2952157 RepID=A0ABT1M2L7_9MYCO|nr:acyl-[acyl-carrier-protein] thioesterase [Mycolicibacterium sp. CAU 1645]MCP9273399.1 acyl-[acyl-carrier-protein] thioesterase [Mycolicibacterium sp. CAU 1645]
MTTPDAERPLSPLPEAGYVYRTSWPVMTGDIDDQLHLRLDGVGRYIQEVGAENLVDAGEAENHPHWIVNRTVIDVIEPIEWPNDISFSRWCSALSSRWCTMRVQLVGSDGGRIETEGFWIAINKDTLTPSRVSDTLTEKFASTTTEHRLKWRPWLRDLTDATAESPFALRRTDIDIFQHVTNAVYWHAVHEVMADHPDIATAPYRAVVEYRKPIRYGEQVVIRSARDGDSVHIALTVDDAVRAAALLRKL